MRTRLLDVAWRVFLVQYHVKIKKGKASKPCKNHSKDLK